jgi:glycosyltransferase involved in cell wall biosynthesis
LVKNVECKPDVSVVVVVYNIPREVARTLHSLSAIYQRHIHPDDYEVIVVDNGSNPPLNHDLITGLAGNFRLIRIDPAPPSPAQAVNRGLAESRGEIIGVMIDGARIVTPGLVHFARHGARLHPHAVVVAPGWYLGYDFQSWAIQFGYNQAREDALLSQIRWPEDGYRLFEIATPDECSVEGWLQPVDEANALFMPRNLWDKLGGMDERFDVPGGGFINADTYGRAIELADAQLVLLLGEGTFHQVHGGIATNRSPEQLKESLSHWGNQYETLRGHPYHCPIPKKPPMYVGTLPRPALIHFIRAAIAPIRGNSAPPFGLGFDQGLWSPTPPVQPRDPVIAGLVALAQQEFVKGRYAAAAYIARLSRSHAPDEPEPQRLLSLTAAAVGLDHPSSPEFFYAVAEAHRLLGENEPAASNYRRALTLNRNFQQAHVGLATLRLPGDLYYVWLDRFYSVLSPEAVIEIGVADGASLALVHPATLAIGVDPNPNLMRPLKAETHIFPDTSDAFFARQAPDALLDGRALGVAFIDGLHLYEQALRDFIHLESYCGPRSVILFHDTLPLDEATQSRTRDTQFYTGDVWKTVLCLKNYRPDLDVFTIATPWTGLTVVTGLDAKSRVLTDKYEEAVEQFIDKPFSAIESNLESELNVVPNDWATVESRLKERQIL